MNLNQLKALFFQNTQLSQIVFKNTSWMVVANIIAKAFKFGMMIVVARELGPGLFGEFNYIIVLSAMCFMLSDVGLNLLIIREFSNQTVHRPTLIATGFSVKLLVIFINIMFASVLCFFLDPLLKLPFVIFSAMNTIDGVKQYWITLNRAHLKQQHEGIGFIIETTVTSILGATIALNSMGIVYLSAAYFFGSFLAGMYLFVKTKQFMQPLKHTCPALMKDLIRKMTPFTLSISLATAITIIDTLMIQWMLGFEAVGLYNSGLKISENIIIIPTIFGSVLFPFFTQFQTKPDRLFKLLKESLAILFMIGCPVIFGGIYLSQDIIHLIFSDSYTNSTVTFRYLLGATLFIFWFIPINGLLLATNLEKKCITNISIGCLANIILNLGLIPIFGIVGAGIGTFVGRMFLLILHLMTIKKTQPSQSLIIKRNIHYIGLSIAMLGIIFIVEHIISHTLLLILIGGIAYILLLLLIKDPSIKKITNLLMLKGNH